MKVGKSFKVFDPKLSRKASGIADWNSSVIKIYVKTTVSNICKARKLLIKEIAMKWQDGNPLHFKARCVQNK